jgi:inner membrane protein involved in colicin E2 resistance
MLIFGLIAAVMIDTRKVDWHRLGRTSALGETAA